MPHGIHFDFMPRPKNAEKLDVRVVVRLTRSLATTLDGFVLKQRETRPGTSRADVLRESFLQRVQNESEKTT